MAPDDAEIVHVRALTLDSLGRDREAREAYQQVLRLQPDHVNANLNLAALMARTADPLESLALLDRVEAVGGVPPAGYAVAARLLHFIGEDERALAYVEKAIERGSMLPMRC
jgi:tetratricopeptide (TPR) repeat protein